MAADAPDKLLARAERDIRSGKSAGVNELARAVAQNPGWVRGHIKLADAYWEAGHGLGAFRFFEDALKAERRNAALWNAYIAALLESGHPAEAADAASDAFLIFNAPILQLMVASYASQAGQLDRADRLFRQFEMPQADHSISEALVRHALRMGDYVKAAAILDDLLRARREDIAIWALAQIIWRLTDDPRLEFLIGRDALVKFFSLDLDSEDLSALAGLLRAKHVSRAAPLGQSVRGGTQTRGDLFEGAGSSILTLKRALANALEAYRRTLPEPRADHPLLKYADRPFSILHGWSVRLTEGGHHVSHLHPVGIVSSACYICLPSALGQRRQGVLQLGVPPEDLGLSLPALSEIHPKIGHVALFPSFLHHGTTPFSEGERLSVAFDAVPVR
ncbi:hypothetical protein KCG44_07670 [Pacificimonas sp. WHA3]|uniref:TPR domain protein n=1 Tax=Pacificimonas pallii TaxID=2827236 RepID=A0ABS6SFE6_9SPHN|nr:putative 2OG-Fe(II) oxygenase [Pacificimonas pallii]MBV7256661.1 hypothetical protein [Pacificimonas pallii]